MSCIGNVNSALDMTNELLELNPQHERAKGNKYYYEKELSLKSEKKFRGDDGTSTIPIEPKANKHSTSTVYNSPERKTYEMLCRGDMKLSDKKTAQLKCRYVTNKSAFLKIAPLKLEEAFLDPYIVIYHEVISDREIETVKNMAKPRVSTVFYK